MSGNVRSTLWSVAVVASLAAGLAATPRALGAGSACEALGPADIASLGFDAVQPGSPGTSPGKVVSLESTASIMGVETECLWQTGHGSVRLLLGDFDANLVKGDDVRRLGEKVLASVRSKLETGAKYGGVAVTVVPQPGVGDEAWTARYASRNFDVFARKGLRLARLIVSYTGGIPRAPTSEQAGTLLSRVLSSGSGYTSAGAPPVKGEEPWAGPDDRYVVTGSVVASGSLSGTFVWSSPNAVEAYPDKTEIVLATADKKSWMNLQVFRGEDRIEVRSAKLSAGVLRGKGRASTVDALAGSGTVTVDGTVSAASESVTLKGSLTIRPAKR